MTKGELEQHFTVLEIEPGASPQEIKRAWRTLAKVWHPDRFPNDPRLRARGQEKLKELDILPLDQYRVNPMPQILIIIYLIDPYSSAFGKYVLDAWKDFKGQQ